jgi:uncharacterized membrane protein YkoI
LILLFFFYFGVENSYAFEKKQITPTQAKQIAEQQYGGKALSVKMETNGVVSVYRVKLIKAGRVKTVTISANP